LVVDNVHAGSFKFYTHTTQSGDSKKAYKVHKIHGKHVIVLDPQLIDTLKIDDETWLLQEADGTSIRLILKNTKNRAAGLGYQTNTANSSADSGLDYQYEHV
jgi:hypothetical protein